MTSVFHMNLVDLNEKNQLLPIIFVLPICPFFGFSRSKSTLSFSARCSFSFCRSKILSAAAMI
jgi:hypothetical protein